MPYTNNHHQPSKCSGFNVRFYLLLMCTASMAINNVNSANILCLMGTASPSHHIWNTSIMKALANRGNNLTILTIEAEQSTANMHFIHMENVYQALYAHYVGTEEQSDTQSQFVSSGALKAIVDMYGFYGFVDTKLVDTQGVQQLLRYPVDFRFDLIIHDFTSAHVLLGFVDRFRYPPLVSISAFGMPSHTTAVSGMVNFASHIPHAAASTYSNRMTFVERSKNAVYFLFDWFYRNYVYMVNENRKARKLFGQHMPALQTIEARTQVVLVNIDFSIDNAQLLPPNVIAVGGLQVKRVEPLDEELQLYLDNARAGAVFFSLGTNVLSSYLGGPVKAMLLQAIAELSEYNFVWKYESDDLKDLPANLLIRDWLPQNSILHHPNVKLFITHAGLLSTQESIWHGVPMLGIPFFLDQHQNIKKVINAGIGEKLNVHNLTVPEIVDRVRSIITTKSYGTNAKERSEVFRDQPMHPLDRAIFWIEFVLAHKGSSHLRLDTSHLFFVQKYLLDVVAAIGFVLFSFVFLLVKHCCWRRDHRRLQRAVAVEDNNVTTDDGDKIKNE